MTWQAWQFAALLALVFTIVFSLMELGFGDNGGHRFGWVITLCGASALLALVVLR